MKQKKIIILISILIAALAVVGYVLTRNNSVFENKITGTVSNIINKPNHMEDGYYGFDITDSSGKKYRVDATGYLNMPASPDSLGDTCVKIPKVKDGDQVEFNLPKSPEEPNTFSICHEKELTGYYFRLNNWLENDE